MVNHQSRTSTLLTVKDLALGKGFQANEFEPYALENIL